MTKGFLTIALKHPLYGRYAYNLALSIKSADPSQAISVIADEDGLRHLHEGQRMLFDEIITPEPYMYHVDDKVLPLLIKFHLHELTPYTQETQFIDADMIFSPMADFKKLWSDMKDIDFTMANRGENKPDKGISEWVDSGKLKEAYPEVKQWYDLSSEWIYFKSTPLAESIFVSARMFYDEGKLLTRQFAGDKPDEPFFNLALDLLHHAPHKAPWQPTYWQPAIRKVLNAMEIKRQYYAFSAGGNHLPPQQQRVYDELLKNASYRMNMPGFTIPHKRSQLKERIHI